MKSKKNIVLIAMSFFVVVALVVSLLINNNNNNKVENVLDYDKEVFDIFFTNIFLTDYLEENEETQANGYYVSYLSQSQKAISALYFNDDIEYAAEVVEKIMSTFYAEGYLPRPTYDDFEYGWVTAMDAPLTALVSRMLYEKTGEEKFSDYTDDLIEYSTKTIDENGFNIVLESGNIWPLEYANTETTEENALFVYNGSLFGAAAISILATIDDYSDELADLAESYTNAYIEKSELFYYPDEEWTHYMLNPTTINQNIKVVIELRAFISLYETTGNEFYNQEIARRQAIYEKTLQIYVEPNGNDEYKYYFLRGAAPHPYLIDIYDNTLEFYNDKGEIVQVDEFTGRGYDDSLVTGTIPKEVTGVKIYASPEIWKVLLTDTEIIISEENDYENIGFEIEAEEGTDIVQTDIANIFELSEEKTERASASVVLNLEKDIEYDNNYLYAIEVNNTSDQTIVNSMIFYESEANGGDHKARYYQPLTPGKNLILVNTLGFTRTELTELGLEDINKIQLNFFTSGLGDLDGSVEIDNVYIFENTIEYANYKESSEYLINFATK